MPSFVLQGELLLPDGWSEATIEIEDGRISHYSDGIETCDRPVKQGLIFPGLMDMHTHLGDLGARGDLPPRLEDAVFPGGVKHDYLDSCSEEELSSSIRHALEELHHGATFVMDFREGGVKGAAALDMARYDNGPTVFSMGRILDGENPMTLIDIADGLGIPSLKPNLGEFRELSRLKNKPFSIHVSELFREDIEAILELKPDQLIHMVSGTKDDWEAVSSENIPVVLCPRSNQTFDIDVPLGKMFDSGLCLSLGTDNSLSSMHDMFREMENAWLLIRKLGLNGSDAARHIFSMATGESIRKTPLMDMLPGNDRWWKKDWPQVGSTPNFFVCRRPRDELWKKDPYSFAVRFLDRSQLIFTGHF